MTGRACEWCDAPMRLAREGARFCSPNHRLRAHRAAKRNDSMRVAVPVEMAARERWMRWELVRRGDRFTKRPVAVDGSSGSSTNAAKWASLDAACASSLGVGVGFALGDGIGCIDLDHAIVDGVVAEWALEILARTPGTYVEVSQSGEGLHIFGWLPEGGGRNIRDGVRCVEFYSAGRYIAVTGNRFDGSPLKLADLRGAVASIL